MEYVILVKKYHIGTILVGYRGIKSAGDTPIRRLVQHLNPGVVLELLLNRLPDLRTGTIVDD